eukprot:CAMPEP_0205904622 /NCGR_PEP_ID=MMETSP1325-20131115/844_1 /ASSEMBLY_ACC=CAM_ASM_000708 /TAXON_ID=236786 /ORGANISM="Florenciella sp., Strain RCC1007" /LENGTH=43 /DNA_ID= /DNA_START= /DNA_END= /DNA_ORIENTATION=
MDKDDEIERLEKLRAALRQHACEEIKERKKTRKALIEKRRSQG